MKGLDSMLALMETAEEGRSTEIDPPQKVRHYGEAAASDPVDYVVVDRPVWISWIGLRLLRERLYGKHEGK
jgi:hypothetical protein